MGRALENPGRTDGGRTSAPKHLATSRGWGAELSQNPWISLLLEMKSGIKAQTRRLEYLPCACVFCSISWSLGHWVPPLPPRPHTVTILLERKRLSLRVDVAFKLPTLLGKGGAKLSATHFTHLSASLFPHSGSVPKVPGLPPPAPQHALCSSC